MSTPLDAEETFTPLNSVDYLLSMGPSGILLILLILGVLARLAWLRRPLTPFTTLALITLPILLTSLNLIHTFIQAKDVSGICSDQVVRFAFDDGIFLLTCTSVMIALGLPLAYLRHRRP